MNVVEVPEREARLRICRLMITMAKDLNADLFGPDSNFGAELDTIFIACAVLIGHAEGRAMTANKIALYLGMPRTTVLRKLQRLLKINVVTSIKGRYFVSADRLAKDKHMLVKLGAAISKAV